MNNRNGSQKKETTDNLNRRPVVTIFIDMKNGQPTWSWKGLSRQQVEMLFLDCYRGQVRYNIEQEIKEKNKPKILIPNLNQVIMSNKK